MINEEDIHANSGLDLPSTDDDDIKSDWSITFADLMTLLLTFFILLYSMSKIDVEKYLSLADSLRKTHGIEVKTETGKIISGNFDLVAENVTNLNDILNKKLEEILRNINIFVFQNQLQNIVKAYIDERGVVINISDSMLFKEGDDNLTPQSRTILNYLMELFQTFPYPLLIEGHTDNSPIGTIRFPSNWELSTLRACNVIKYFISKGISPSRLSAEGFGEFRPIANNATYSGRSMNRRVEIVFKRSGIMKTLQDNVEPTL
ncbi:MAG: OmpA family protein [Candidatus Margulisbacteria bacterium]|nr:OmpA family protein [Candidatus Margulisiibacteriota bacterium]